MKAKNIIMLSAATLALAACGPKSGTVDNSSMTAATNDIVLNDTAPVAVSASQAFVNAAAASDAFEIASSKLALATSPSAAVKKFAQKMIDAHTGSTAKLKTAAAEATPAIVPDPAVTAEQQAKLDALKLKAGADFDTAYIADQTAGHQATLDVLKGYSATGDVPALKTFATGLVPTVTAHLNMAKALKP